MTAAAAVTADPMAERFTRNTADHQMTVLHDDGLYRHLRFAQPEHSWLYWFEIVTWPGSLTVKGDCGTFTFSREADMFGFFRAHHGSYSAINPSYWGEKTPGGVRSVREYSEDQAKKLITDHLAEVAESGTEVPASARERIADYDDEGRLGYEDGARDLLAELEKAGVVSDVWEWDLTDWQWEFLWCCHAIAWGIAQYDPHRQAAPEAADR